jgi:hypothetical protein
MALWGDKDNINSVGTVELDYSTLVVTGTGTSFGQVGSASTGDVIRFGTYPDILGDAVVVGITSARVLSIGSTSGLSGAAISGQQFDISQLPKYTIHDSVYKQETTSDFSTTTVSVTTATTSAAIGVATVAVASTSSIVSGDLFTSGSNSNLVVSSIGSTTVSLASTISSGISTAATITFSRRSGGRNSDVLGVSTAGSQASQTTAFETGVGWVGITTYKDYWGNLRVKKEILVAMSGIQTGNTPLYDANPLV